MKILSCHIENFGILSNRSFSFTDGVNTVLEDNGCGKSTMAVFIKSMLFGFSNYRGRDIEENERRKYYPWQGGVYGGYLEFEAEGITYRVERTFGDKEAQDTVRLYEMPRGRESTKYPADRLGEELFGIDASGFEKSVYYSQRYIKRDPKDDVYQKLTDLMEEDNDMGSFGQADGALSDALKKFNKNSGNDILSQTKAERDTARRNLENARNRLTALAQKEKDKLEYEAALSGVRENLKAVRETVQLARLRDRYIDYTAKEREYQDASATVAAYEKEFRGGVPKEREAGELPGRLERLYAVESSVQELEKELAEQQRQFVLYERGETPEHERLREILKGFDDHPPSQADLDRATAMYGEINRINHALSSLTVKTETVKKIRSKYALLFGILAFALIVAGAATIAFVFDAGVALLSVGAVAAGAAVAVHVFAGKKEQKAAQMELQKKKAALTAEREDISKKLDAFFAGYKLSAGDVPKTLMSLQQELGEYNKHREAVERELERTANAIGQLTAKLKEYGAIREAMNRELNDYFEQKGIQSAGGLREAYQTFSYKYGRYLRQKAVATDCERRWKATEKPALPQGFAPDDPAYDLETLNKKEKYLHERERELTAAILRLEEDIRGIQSDVEQIPEFEESEENCNARLTELTKEKALLTKTRELLRQAHDNLTQRYQGQLKQYFNRYASAVLDSQIDMTLDTRFEYKIEERGALREEEHFSRGLRDLFDIAAHLALTDALFKGEKPFLLLDDPFKNLDDTKLARAKDMLETLGKERQIIYLVCHSSRA